MTTLYVATGKWIDVDTDEEYQSICMDIFSTLGEEGSMDESTLEQIYSGANSVIYVSTDRTNAIKEITIAEICGNVIYEDVIREVYILTLLKNQSNILQIGKCLFSFENNSHLVEKVWIITSIFDGNLATFIHEAKSIMHPWINTAIKQQLSLAIKTIHSLNILHLDIKPQNILISNERDCVLADFGCAHLANEQGELMYYRGGTPRYIRPTTLKLWHTNHIVRTKNDDLWGLECVFFEMDNKEVFVTSDLLPTSLIIESALNNKERIHPAINILKEIDDRLTSGNLSSHALSQFLDAY